MLTSPECQAEEQSIGKGSLFPLLGQLSIVMLWCFQGRTVKLKVVADGVEALLGAYFMSGGLQGAWALLAALKILPLPTQSTMDQHRDPMVCASSQGFAITQFTFPYLPTQKACMNRLYYLRMNMLLQLIANLMLCKPSDIFIRGLALHFAINQVTI